MCCLPLGSVFHASHPALLPSFLPRGCPAFYSITRLPSRGFRRGAMTVPSFPAKNGPLMAHDRAATGSGRRATRPALGSSFHKHPRPSSILFSMCPEMQVQSWPAFWHLPTEGQRTAGNRDQSMTLSFSPPATFPFNLPFRLPNLDSGK